MRDERGAARGPSLAWSAIDLRRALLRRASFPRAASRRRKSGGAVSHAGVPRRAVRRLGLRAAASLVRNGNAGAARVVILDLLRGRYHDEQMLGLEILDRLSDLWREWAIEMVVVISRDLRHPWSADRLARIQGRLLAKGPALMSKHVPWALSPNPVRRRIAVAALLPHRGPRGSRGVPAARAIPVLRLLLDDPEPHPWVRPVLGRALVHYAARAPRAVARLLAAHPPDLEARHLERTRRLLEG
jgi:hypothetical protein